MTARLRARTRPPRRPSLVALALFALALGVAADATTGWARDTPATISVSEIHAGMRGYGLTVFKGRDPQRFDVEVIGVLHNFRPDQDLILIRTPNPLLDRAKAVAGMSGSPIYLDGRLAGAYAYGWTFGSDPVVGVTPIANMMRELRRPLRPDAFPGAAPFAGPQLASAAGTHARWSPEAPYDGSHLVSAFDALDRFAARSSAPVGVHRARTPLMLGGFSDEAAQLLRGPFAQLGLDVLQTGGGTRRPPPDAHTRFVPGGSLAVQLIRGDVTATAVGTVTAIAPDGRVLAFGHPLFNAGQEGFPTATARVVHVLISQQRSFKIAEAETPLGALTQDRQAAIIANPKIDAPTVPVHVHLSGLTGVPRTDWNAEVVNHRALTPSLAFATLVNALSASVADSTDVMYEARTRVGIAGHEPVTFDDKGYMDSGPLSTTPLTRIRAFSAMEAAYSNPFERSYVTSFDIDLHIRYARDVLRIVDLASPVSEIDPGATLPVRVTLQSPDGRERVEVVPVKVPLSAAGQKLQLQAEPGPQSFLPHPRPRTLDDILESLAERYPATSMVVSLKLPSRGLRFGSHVARALPPSALEALQSANAAEPGRPFVTRERREVPLGAVVMGSASLKIEVRDEARLAAGGKR